jgi:branched-chain amino acid transport system ATP-binding protein/neutral amino acid transport system ATP-binding protein
MMSDPILVVRGLARRFGGVVALDGLDLEVRRGSVTALIGPNGAGKSTAFQCISGVIQPDSGRVTFDGTDITGARPDRVTRAGLVRSFQIARGFPSLTVMESLLVYGTDQPGEKFWPALARTRAVKRREEELIEKALGIAGQLRLTRVLNNLTGEISGGQKKLLEIGRALMSSPRMILLDEPMAGVNPSLGNEIGEQIRALNRQGLTFVIIEHDMSWVGRLCDPVIVMADGRVLTQGSFEAVISNPEVQNVYMGLEA